jgi:MoxR-like ATPase
VRTYGLDKPEMIVGQMIDNVEKVMIGKRNTIEKVMVALLGGGHVLLEDVPGVGKTMLVKALSATLGGEFRRVQFTPDLLPSDLTGVSIFNSKTREFEFRPGPLMANIVLADELNRTSPRTQAALLEAMEEKQMTVDGITYPLPSPFMVMATQNPTEFEGAYRLPEAQLDRFFIKTSMGYPNQEEEVQMLARFHDQHPIHRLKPIMTPDEFLLLQQKVRTIHIDAAITRYIVQIIAQTRCSPTVYLGASPRASMALMRAAQAHAFMNGRRYVIPDDIKILAGAVLSHRLLLKSEARLKGATTEAVIAQIIKQTPVPGVSAVSV